MDIVEIGGKLALFFVPFLFALCFHEYAHGLVAKWHGDDTAEKLGRLTLNPMAHADILGTFILPISSIVFGIPLFFGWANPVPVDPRYFKKVRQGIFWVSFAGPGMNIILGSISALLAALLATKVSPEFYFYKPFTSMLVQSVVINFVLAAFNLIPFPPLDGSKMVTAVLDYNAARKYEELERFSFIFIIVLLMTPILNWIMAPAILFSNFVTGLFITLLG